MKKYMDKFNKTLVVIDIIFVVAIILSLILASGLNHYGMFLEVLEEIFEFLLLALYVIIIIYSLIKIIISIKAKKHKMLLIPITSLLIIIIYTLLFFFNII